MRTERIAPRIFIVEDEALISMELTDRLAGLGYWPCGQAARGEVALTRIRESKPDLVLMDINLAGDLDGIETAQQVRQQFNLPVLFLTAYSDPDLVTRAMETNSYGYLVKPFDERELRANIEFALYKHATDVKLREASRLIEQRSAELELANQRLTEALNQVKELRGIIPICMYCKKIRNDKNYWEAVEVYISRNTDAMFSHGLCPQCAEAQRQS
ncbi:MAG: response regulator [Acidobacteriia bacterium]|nr:response regulator [Terriglobia bacterium]